MKLPLLLMLLLFSSNPASAESSDINPDSTEFSALYNPADAEHLILIGFYDQSINRAQNPAPLSIYRRRGDYQSSTWSRRTSEQIAEEYHLEKLTEWPMTEVGVQCVVYRVPAVDSIPGTLQQMAKDQRIKIVQKMHLFSTEAHAYNDPYFKLQSNLRSMQLDQVHDKATGRNVTIGMIDTGVDIQHPDLSGQITRQENFAAGVSSDFASDKHGTAVAGIMVARTDNGAGIAGIAPDARLVAFKACWPVQPDSIAAICNSYTLALALNTAIKAGVNILNMSLTGPYDALLELLLNRAIDNGVIIVAADAGPGKERENFPASLKNVIAVQAIISPEGKPDNPIGRVEAPGENVLTTLPHGTYDFISGSSIAAAEVSGLVAVLLELKPDLSSREIESILLQSETPEKVDRFSGINANQAVMVLCKHSNCAGEGFGFAWRNL
ncbi:MAG: S8 family peptidase [Methylococcales bacterium]